MTRTDADVRAKGMETLIDTLGYVDAERFVMLITKESFDYTEWREVNLDNDVSVRELSKKEMQYVENELE